MVSSRQLQGSNAIHRLFLGTQTRRMILLQKRNLLRSNKRTRFCLTPRGVNCSTNMGSQMKIMLPRNRTILIMEGSIQILWMNCFLRTGADFIFRITIFPFFTKCPSLQGIFILLYYLNKILLIK